MRAEGEWVSSVTPVILVVLSNGATSSLIRTFWGAMTTASCLPSAHFTKVVLVQSRFAFASAMLGAEASNVN